MMDRSELIRYANDTLLDEFQQRLTIQIRYIDNQIAMLEKELGSLKSERNHLNKFFPTQQPELPKVAAGQFATGVAPAIDKAAE